MAATSHALPLSTLSWNLFLFGAGALVMRGAGCTINDMWDRDIDKAVGAFGLELFSDAVFDLQKNGRKQGHWHPEQSRGFKRCRFLDYSFLSDWASSPNSTGIGAFVLLVRAHAHQDYSILLGASSLSLVVLYPLMKRITYWPQAVLGECTTIF
jgi:4-hydroxybenzoate polyprenyltransferase